MKTDMNRLSGLATLLVVFGTALHADFQTEEADVTVAPRATTIALPQSFIEDDSGFRMLGDGLAASLETGRMRWSISGPEGAESPSSVVTIEPVGARAGVAPMGEDLLPGVVSHFRGAPSDWDAGRHTFRSVRYAELWKGIDLVLEAQGQTFKGTYVVAPGADPRAVRMRHHGADAVTIDADGQLIIQTPSGDLVDAAPVAWQEIDGERCDVSVAFAIEAAQDGAVDVSFRLGEHDPTLALLIDPAVIVQAGFLGGAANDTPVAVRVDSAGNVYVCGYTLSDEATFPVLVGPELVWDGPSGTTTGDAFVAKLDPTGSTLLYAGFIGGFDSDWASGLAVDSLGRAYVGGHTLSTESLGFPVVTGPSVTSGGGIEGWVARVSADGSTLEYCGFVGGNSEDRVFGIDVDDSFRTYIVGRFESLPNTLPLLIGPELLEPGGATDGFIARLTPSGASYEYCGYLGGDFLEDITLVAADATGGAWFAGWTMSSNFPVVGTLGFPFTGGLDLVVGHVAPDGSGLTSSGHIGSQASDFPGSLVLDDAGAAYLAGLTTDAASFPTLLGPKLVPSDVAEGFLMKIAPDAASFEWVGFTNTGAYATAVVDEAGAAWFLTTVSDGTPAGLDTAVGRVQPSGLDLDVLSVLDLPGDTALSHIALVPEVLTPGVTELWLYGSTTADETEFPVVSGPDVTANGMKDAVVLRLQVADDPWVDLGFALAGTYGDPVLEGDGTLGPLSPVNVSLSNALENSPAWMVVGFSQLSAPFLGGTLVPNPLPPGFVVPLSTGPTGSAVLSDTWPTGVVPGLNIYFQHWIQDPAGPSGFSSSNAVQGTTP